MSPGFEIKKQKILEQLTVPEDEYSDRSPKGSIDEGIRELVDEINAISGLVTTSSCAGRISIFLEGKKKNAPAIADELNNSSDPQAIGGPGGKGGGKWLYVSHDPLAPDVEPSQPTDLHALFGMKSCHEEQSPMPVGAQLVHFKFEAMILHLLTSSIQDAQVVLSAASSAGFRESGAMSLSTNQDGIITPMVAVRSTGLAFDTVIGYQTDIEEIVSIVTEAHLKLMVGVAHERFKVNSERIQRFRTALLSSHESTKAKSGHRSNAEWENKAARQARKREEGLMKQRILQQAKTESELADSIIIPLELP